MSRSRASISVAAIEQVYRSGYRRFLGLAVGMLGDVERGRDAVQEAFVRALKSRRELRRVESLEGWLWRTVVNVCLAELRRPRAAIDGSREQSETIRAEQWPELRAVVAALPERQRLVLFLRHYADLDYERIAEVVEIERGTVAATLHAAHRKLRDAMQEVSS